MSQFRFSNLNLYDHPAKTVKVLDIDCLPDGTHITSEGNLPFNFKTPVNVLDASGALVSLAEELMKLELNIVSLDASGSADISFLQGQLDAYKISNDVSVGQLQSDLSTETAQRLVGQTNDAAARETIKTDLETLIASEVTNLSTAINDNASNLSAEILNVEGLISANTLKINTDVANVTQYVDSQKSRIDGILNGSTIDLDQFSEVVAAYESLNTNALATVAALDARVQSLETMISNLTSNA